MRRIARGFLMVVSVLNGAMGLVVGALLMLSPDGRFLGMGVLLPVIGAFPLARVFFRDFFWIGLVMFLALGLSNLAAAVMLVRRSDRQYLATLIAGILLLLWCGFELIYMFNAGAVGFFVVGALSVLASVVLGADAQGSVRQAHPAERQKVDC